MFEKPYFALSLVFIFSVLGSVSFRHMQKNLFPDANRPQIAVVTIEPGASAEDIANHISRRIEEELHTIDLVRKVSSTSKDEVSVVLTEFEYEKGLDAAAVDVTNALSKIITTLPDDILAPQIYKISDATQPIMILAVKPKDGHPLSLAQVRQIADNELKDDLLNIPGVADVDVFGGYQREIRIDIDPGALDRYGLSVSDVASAVSLKNKNIPAGLIIDKKNHILLKSADEVKHINEFMNIQVADNVKLKDLSYVHYGYKDRLSVYHGNGSPAIGLGIMRAVGANTMAAIKEVNAKLPLIKAKYGNLDIQTADTQERLINLSINNMLGALRDAIIMTLIMIFLFLANIRSIIITTASILFTYLMTIAFMHIVHLEFNIVTMTAIILAVGLLLDDAIVVMENIERHYYELKKPIRRAALEGTTEIMLADFAGTFTTIIVLVPILFIGGYVQRILRELCSVLILALISSYIVSITIIPLLSPLVMKKDPHKNRLESLIYNFSVYFINPLVNFYISLVRIVVEKKKAFIFFLIPLILIMIVTQKAVTPLLGRDLMTPMDTGIVKVSFSTDGNTSIEESDRILSEMERIVSGFPGVQMLSSTLGSEPGTFSFGSGKQPQNGSMTIHFIDRFHRKKNIWQIEDELRGAFNRIPGLHYVNIYDFGATPLSSIASTVDLMVTGDNIEKLDEIGDKIVQRLKHVKGITSVSRSWYIDKRELAFTIDQLQASRYELKPGDISRQVGTALRGRISSIFNIPNENGLDVRVQFRKGYRNSMDDLETMLIKTPFGLVPFKVFARVKPVFSPGVITRQNLNYSLDVYGYRATAAITHIQRWIDKEVIPKVDIPSGYHLSKEGEIAQMKLSSKRLGHAMLLALILLYFSLVVTFSSWKNPFTIMLAIPLAAIGSMWFMLGFGRHQCMPSMMGLILLAGVIVNNSILLIDFIEEGKKRGMDMHDAILEAIRLRARPILMTAFGTSVGMLPVAFQRAIGLERLSPLAVVAIGGLIIGTFLTLIYVPIFYILFERLKNKIAHMVDELRERKVTDHGI